MCIADPAITTGRERAKYGIDFSKIGKKTAAGLFECFEKFLLFKF